MTESQSKPNDDHAPLSRALGALREFFTLRCALIHSAALGAQPRMAARPLERAARERMAGADMLWAKGKAVLALGLYREATLLFAASFASAASLDEPRARAASSQFEELSRLLEPSVRRDPVASTAMTRLRALILSEPGELAGLAGPEGSSEASELARAVHWLAHQLDLRTPLAIKLHRVVRVSIAVGAALAVSLGILAWAFPPVDLALNKPVRASSHAYDTVPEGAVDGIGYGQLGFHSGNDATPWLIVDLGRVLTVHEVKILGRAECCYDQAIPLAVELSLDGEAFHEVARRTEPFTQYEPWVVRLEPTQVRFVRLRTMRHSYLVLSELEVY